MKFIGKPLLYALITLAVAILGLYSLLQARWGAEHVSAWVSENSSYHLVFDAIGHRFSSPSRILLGNVTFGRDGQPAALVAKTTDIGLSSRQVTDQLHVDTILLQNDTPNLSQQIAPPPFQADRLQLQDMALNSPGSEWNLSAQRANGGIIPWSPEAGKILGSKAQIQLSASSLTLNDVPTTNVLIEGSIDHDRVTLSNIGADVAREALTGVAQRNADGSWVAENLHLNGTRPQSDKSLVGFFAPLSTIPSLQVGRLEVTDARLQGPDQAVTDLDSSLRSMTFSKDDWQTQEGKLLMNTSEFIYGSLHFFGPILNAEFSPQGIALRQFATRQEGGMVRTSGNWMRNNKTLVLDDAATVSLKYTLPENWKQLWMKPLPAWPNSLTLKKFSASRNLVIDIDPNSPWQLTTLDGCGTNLGPVQNNQWGIWSGSATPSVVAATFNRMDVRRPSLALTANNSTINISELSVYTEKGLLEATASISQLPQRQTQASLNGRDVPTTILQRWGWPALSLSGGGNTQLTASGSIQADAPLKPTVNGQLHAVNVEKQQVTQTMQAGVASGGEITAPPPAQ